MTGYAYLGDHVGLITTKYGHRMYVDTLDTIAAPHLIIDGDWEGWVADFIRSTLPRGGVFVDIGAHLGWYTLLAHRHGAGLVHAFEPNPRLHELVQRTLSLNALSHQTTLHNLALHDGEHFCELQVPTHWSGNGRLVLDGQQRDSRESSSFKVCTHTLDSCNLGTVDYVKLDAEGVESRILRGAEKTLRENHGIRLLVEHHQLQDEYDTMRWLTNELGFSMAVLTHASRLTEVAVEQLADVPDSEMLYLARQ